jgi:hypothetical protein
MAVVTALAFEQGGRRLDPPDQAGSAERGQHVVHRLGGHAAQPITDGAGHGLGVYMGVGAERFEDGDPGAVTRKPAARSNPAVPGCPGAGLSCVTRRVHQTYWIGSSLRAIPVTIGQFQSQPVRSSHGRAVPVVIGSFQSFQSFQSPSGRSGRYRAVQSPSGGSDQLEPIPIRIAVTLGVSVRTRRVATDRLAY